MNAWRGEIEDEFIELIDAACAGTLLDGDVLRLMEWLGRDEAHRLFYLEYCRMHAGLTFLSRADAAQAASLAGVFRHARETFSSNDGASLDGLPAANGESDAGAQTVLNLQSRLANWPMRRSWSFSIAAAAAAVALMLLTMAYMHLPQYRRSSPAQAERVEGVSIAARLVGTADCRWGREGEISLNDGLEPGRLLDLREGLAELKFAGGATVVIEGPVKFRVIDEMAGRLDEGRLVARVPRSAVGFAIDAPATRIVDLGTEFGVAVGGKHVNVAVFNGYVAVYAEREEDADDEEQNADKPRVLAANEGVRVDRETGEVAPANEDNEDFEAEFARAREWGRTWVPPGVTVSPAIKYLAEPPAEVTAAGLQSDEHAFVFQEHRAFVLKENMNANVSQGKVEFNAAARGVLPAGTVLDSYYFHFAPTREETVAIRAMVQFDRPILAVITGEKQRHSENVLRRGDVAYPDLNDMGWGLEVFADNSYFVVDPDHADQLYISKDRKTISIRLRSKRGACDQFRVLVAANADAEEAGAEVDRLESPQESE